MGYQLSDLVGEVSGKKKEMIELRNSSKADGKCSPNMLLSGSRDKTLIIWNLTRDEQNYGFPKRSLHGHSHIVSDCVNTSQPTQEMLESWVDEKQIGHLVRRSICTFRIVG